MGPNEAALERTDPAYLWQHVIAPRLDTYLGRIFERVAAQAYEWLQPRLRLPVVREWARWEGRDRDGKSLEIDIAATLADGRVLTGAVKWPPPATGTLPVTITSASARCKCRTRSDCSMSR